MAADNPTVLQPLDFLQITKQKRKEELADETAVIVLNQPISGKDLVNRLWTNSTYRICADGGANRLYDLFEGFETTLRSAYVPNAIHGDLDSLRKDVGLFYQKNKSEITLDEDQFSTDFGKAIKKVFEAKPDICNIAVVGGIAGRVDQGIGLLSEMMREQQAHPNVRFWLFSEESISFVLRKGTTLIDTPLEDGLITPNIGVLPVYGAARITTKGLEWDVSDWETMMGGRMSTSNHITADQLSITTDTDVVFTVERA